MAACGGGGSSTTAAVIPTLSADQAIYENLSLTPGATYSLNWSLPTAGAPTTGTQYLGSTNATLPKSPLTNGAQTVPNAAYVSMSSNLPLPTNLPKTRYLYNGQILVEADPAKAIVSYNGTGVEVDNLAADGTTVVVKELRSGYSSVPLSGLVTATPTTFAYWFNSLFTNTALLKPAATWASGAGYIQFTATNISDVYEVFDATTTTYGALPSPVATGSSIAALMGSGGIPVTADLTTYTLANGTVSVINGVNTYVATSLRPNTKSPHYRAFYELNGNVYTGQFLKAGTVLGGNSYINASNVAAKTGDYQIRLNKAANDSLTAALTF